MEFKLNLGADIDQNELSKKLKRTIEESLESQIRAYFRAPYHTHRDSTDKGGVGYQIIKDKLESLLLDESFSKKIDAMIQRHFDVVLEAATAAALDHALRGKAFPALANKLAEKAKETYNG